MPNAAVFQTVNEPLTIEDIYVDDPGPYEVLVKTMATGVCHSDLHFVEGLYMIETPAVMGHEGAGIVEKVGDLVLDVAPGDHVILCLSVYCGRCRHCITGHPARCQTKPMRGENESPRISWNDQPLVQMANLATYAEKMLVHENSVVKIREDMPFEGAALIGCGVTTGVGAALNTAKVEPGLDGCGLRRRRCRAGSHTGRATRWCATDYRGRYLGEQAQDRDGSGCNRHCRRFR